MSERFTEYAVANDFGLIHRQLTLDAALLAIRTITAQGGSARLLTRPVTRGEWVAQDLPPAVSRKAGAA
ncbi:hypothetical protein [Streptacidiphilus monticola]|uniref:Uncharacterized protein n=1 Tax=Streptacidiphilus monticola TaxID=2161674 RepID=A0ABW1FV09_9ACTN